MALNFNKSEVIARIEKQKTALEALWIPDSFKGKMKEFEADLDELRNYAGNSEKVVKALEEACLESIGEIVDAIKEEFNRKLKAVSTIGGLSSSKSPSRSSESRTGSSLRSSESSRGSSSRSSESGRSFLLGSW